MSARKCTAAPAPRGATSILLLFFAAVVGLALVGPRAARPGDAPGGQAARRALLDRFNAAKSVPDKLALLPELRKALPEAELPAEARYLTALSLLRPHLSWHAGFPPPEADRLRDVQKRQEEDEDGPNAWRWAPANGGEEWMVADKREAVAAEVRGQEVKAASRAAQPRDKQADPAEGSFWLLKDPAHPDVARALALLDGVPAGAPFAEAARRWAADVRRNNTVLTFDVAGRYDAGKDAFVVLDVRSADRVHFTLFRLKTADELLAVARRVGEDFTFRDYGLQGPQPLVPAIDRMKQLAQRLRESRRRTAPAPLPDRSAWQVVGRWGATAGELPGLPAPNSSWVEEDEWDDWRDQGRDEESDYFGDACEEYHDRIYKTYRPEPGGRSAWQCDRVVKVPGAMLKEAGAYVLAAEANGQAAVAPVLVDPPLLTMRRCRDGVFAVVSSPDGVAPAAGARVVGPAMLGTAVTDEQGVTFAKLFAGGDVPVVATTADGRFAVGGFGRLFEGVYVSQWELEWRREWWHWNKVEMKSRALHALRQMAEVYADRYVVAAYTDRPTYRPGQQMHFKLIARRLKKDDGATTRPQPGDAPATPATAPAFRENDFNFTSRLERPEADGPVSYAVLSPRGRVVASGQTRLNDFGTAAGSFTLSSEEATGEYTLRVNVGGETRVVPDVFAVQYYRRPNFELRLAGVPARVERAGAIEATLSADYYFGKPVAGGRAEVRLVGAGREAALARAEARLDDAGRAAVGLDPPMSLAAGRYTVVATLTDNSGRTVTQTAPYEVGPAATAGEWEALPAFADASKPLTVRSTAARLTLLPPGEPGRAIDVPMKDGSAELRFVSVGWYEVSDGQDARRVFAYGGSEPPPWSPGAASEPGAPEVRWVNLTDYHAEADGPDRSRETRFSAWDDAGSRLLALFERRRVSVGDRLRVLVYVPAGRGRVLFTMEGRTVLDYFTADVNAAGGNVAGGKAKAGSYQVVEIPVTARMAPNFYLQGRFLRAEPGGEEPQAAPQEAPQEAQLQQAEKAKEEDDDPAEDPRWCRVDVSDPKALPGGQTLRVDVKSDRDAYRPGDDVGVTMRVTGADGKPRRAEVSLAAVDESVFAFGADRSAAAVGALTDARPERMYVRKSWRSGPRPLGDRSAVQQQRAQQLQQMAQQMAEAKLGKAASDLQRAEDLKAELAGLRPQPTRLPPALAGGMLPATSFPLAEVRSDFRETAAWQPQLRTGDDGVARATFRLPDSLTAYRLTAVGVTQGTEVGTGSAGLRASKPLAVQVFLPRFLVEKDRLQLVALVHNDRDEAQRCDAAWTVKGLAAEAPDGWRRQASDVADETMFTGRINVPAHGSARVPLWATANQVGTASVAFFARATGGGADSDSDAERRAVPVQPLGRPAEAAFNGVIDSVAGETGGKTAGGKAAVRLPAGFVVSDLHVSLARSNVGGSMEGVGYLVDYSYGCVEQTMSRFLPAVIVARASRQSGVSLPPEVQAKLPDVLAKGLTRLYNFQHADGGWGWWEKDNTNDAMTVYVVDGLARCRGSGVEVDGGALSRGCDYLDGKLRQGSLPADLQSRAWLALARAGRADRERLKAYSAGAGALQSSPTEVALACRLLSLDDPARRLWDAARAAPMPADTAALAERLLGQVEFGEPDGECLATADMLLARRQGARWESTRATAEAVESLAEVLRLVSAHAPAKRMRIAVAGKTLLEAKGGDDLSRIVHRVHLRAGQLPPDEAVPIDLEAEAPEPVHYTVAATGTQHLDHFDATGTEVKLTRRYATIDGAAADKPVPADTVLAAHVTLELAHPASYLIVEDRRPSTCEFADDRLAGAGAADAAHVEFRDDRVCAFFTSLPAGKHELVYYLRAETPGDAHVLPGCAYPMYQERTRGETASATVSVMAK